MVRDLYIYSWFPSPVPGLDLDDAKLEQRQSVFVQGGVGHASTRPVWGRWQEWIRITTLLSGLTLEWVDALSLGIRYRTMNGRRYIWHGDEHADGECDSVLFGTGA